LIDPATGRQSETAGSLELYSLTASRGLSVVMTQDINGSAFWHIAPSGMILFDLEVKDIPVNANPSALDMVAISTDGRQVAYVSDSGLMLYEESRLPVSVDLTLSRDQEIAWIGWGPTGWRIGHLY
jgi:hypothetical protein